MDERIIIRHLNLGKANQTEEFPVKLFKEVTFGRDTTCEVKYDPERDDLVSRRHAKITVDKQDPVEFSIADLSSRNGTFVNKQRISNSVKLMPGDVVQFGAGGPEFQFDVEPKPFGGAKPTRLGTDIPPMILPPTREGALPGAPTGGPGGPPTGGPPHFGPPQPPPLGMMPPPGGVGKATVERMIVQQKKQTNTMLFIATGLVLLLVAGIGAYVYLRKPVVISGPTPAAEKLGPGRIAEMARDSVVFLEVSWKLVDIDNGRQLNQAYLPIGVDKDKHYQIDGAGTCLPVFITFQGNLEPVLSTEDKTGKCQHFAIGGTHTGSGFVVSSDGFILTNRHVAATWHTRYNWRPQDGNGVEITVSDQGSFQLKGVLEAANFPSWVPANAQVVSEGPLSIENARIKHKQISGKAIEGRNDYLDVTFAKARIRIPAKLTRVSDQADVAMAKIDLPRSVQKLDLNDNFGTIKAGDDAIVMGYPGVSPMAVAVTGSKDVFNSSTEQKVIPDPTVSVGNIGRVIKGSEMTGSGEGTISQVGELYQLTINSTGGGNSGGPVFDEKGRVIAIYNSGSQRAGASVSFAVPIKYGMELMGVSNK